MLTESMEDLHEKEGGDSHVRIDFLPTKPHQTEDSLARDTKAVQADLPSQSDSSGSPIPLPLPPDGGWGWVIVLCCFLCNGMVDGMCSTFGIFLPHFLDAFGDSRAKTTIAGSLMAGGFMLTGNTRELLLDFKMWNVPESVSMGKCCS